MDRVIVAFESKDNRLRVKEMLEREGIFPASCTASGAGALRAALELGGGVVVCGYKMSDMSAPELAASLPQTGVLLLVASPTQLDMVADDDIFRIAAPLSRGDLAASVRMLMQLERQKVRQMRPRRPDLEKQIIAQAKEKFMEKQGFSEQEAYRAMQKKSMDQGRPLVEIAAEILKST